MAIDAILIYFLGNNGNKGKNMELVRKVNNDLMMRIQNKYGLARKITTKDSIRQGVLSVTEYAALIYEIAKELKRKGLGITTSEGVKLGCLLWLDDAALIHK